MKLLRRLSALLSHIESALVVLILTVMVLLAFLQVVLRNFFSTGIVQADPFLRHLVVWAGFCGASLATGSEKHINLDILSRFVPPRAMDGIRTLTNLFAAAVSYFLARAAWVFVVSEMSSEEPLFTIGATLFPAWWFQTIIPAGFALMAFRFLLRAAGHAGAFISPASAPPPDDAGGPTNVPAL